MCRIDIPLTDCKVPCFNMTPAKSGVATHKNGIESHANLTDCHGHALQLAVSGTIKLIKKIKGTLNTAFELNKPIKYSML